MQVHRLDVAAWQHERRTFAAPRADCAEDVGGYGALVLWRSRPRADQRPAARDLVLLPDPGFVAEPDLYVGPVAPKAGATWIDALLARDLVQQGSEAVLKRSIAPFACA